MVMLVVHITALVLIAYILGCVAGALLRSLLAPAVLPAGAGAPRVTPPQPAALPPLQAGPYRWHAALEGQVVTLGGSVPSEAARANLVDVAQDIAPTADILDQMTLAGGAPEGFAPAARAGLKALATLSQGRVRLTDLTLAIEGPAINENAYQQIKALGRQPPGRGFSVDATRLERPLAEEDGDDGDAPASPDGAPRPS